MWSYTQLQRDVITWGFSRTGIVFLFVFSHMENKDIWIRPTSKEKVLFLPQIVLWTEWTSGFPWIHSTSLSIPILHIMNNIRTIDLRPSVYLLCELLLTREDSQVFPFPHAVFFYFNQAWNLIGMCVLELFVRELWLILGRDSKHFSGWWIQLASLFQLLNWIKKVFFASQEKISLFLFAFFPLFALLWRLSAQDIYTSSRCDVLGMRRHTGSPHALWDVLSFCTFWVTLGCDIVSTKTSCLLFRNEKIPRLTMCHCGCIALWGE